MRTVIVVGLVVALLFGVRLLTADDEEKKEGTAPLAIEYVGKWGSVTLPNGFRLSLPQGWEYYTDYVPLHGFVFNRIEKDDGFRPNVHVYWKPVPRTLEAWFDLHKSKYQGGDSEILAEGKQSTAGQAGYWVTYERRSKQKDGTEVVTVTKDWLFGRGPKKGILRGVSTARSFLEPYQQIFAEVHRRLRRSQ